MTTETFDGWEIVDASKQVFLCRCANCGAEREKCLTELRSDRNGCAKCHHLPKGQIGLYHTFVRYQNNAKRNGLAFHLSIERFRELTSDPCYYCGAKPSHVAPLNHRTEWSAYVYNGIDRKCNDQGYVEGNCVSCCEWCNKAKRHMPFVDFVRYIISFAESVGANRVPILLHLDRGRAEKRGK